MEAPQTPQAPAKKPLSDKKIQALKKARVALVKTRDENRLNLHETALKDVIDRQLEAKLKDLMEKMPKPTQPEQTETEETHAPVIIIKKKHKAPQVIEVSETESSQEPVYVAKAKPKHVPTRRPPPKKTAPRPTPRKEDVTYTEAPPERDMNSELFNSIFGR
jgi:hypothetical protein